MSAVTGFLAAGALAFTPIEAGKKTFVGIERDPRWFDAAVERITEAWASVASAL